MSMEPPLQTSFSSNVQTQQVADFVQRIRQRIGTVVVGQDEVVERILIALFTGGHLLLQGVPGLAKKRCWLPPFPKPSI